MRFFDLICHHFNVKKEGNVKKNQVIRLTIRYNKIIIKNKDCRILMVNSQAKTYLSFLMG